MSSFYDTFIWIMRNKELLFMKNWDEIFKKRSEMSCLISSYLTFLDVINKMSVSSSFIKFIENNKILLMENMDKVFLTNIFESNELVYDDRKTFLMQRLYLYFKPLLINIDLRTYKIFQDQLPSLLLNVDLNALQAPGGNITERNAIYLKNHFFYLKTKIEIEKQLFIDKLFNKEYYTKVHQEKLLNKSINYTIELKLNQLSLMIKILKIIAMLAVVLSIPFVFSIIADVFFLGFFLSDPNRMIDRLKHDEVFKNIVIVLNSIILLGISLILSSSLVSKTYKKMIKKLYNDKITALQSMLYSLEKLESGMIVNNQNEDMRMGIIQKYKRINNDNFFQNNM